jgi:polyphosphate kinase
MMSSQDLSDRDLSWLQFNYRVLLEAADKSVPLYERIKFLAIYSSNLDEFFRVRVCSLQIVSEVKSKKTRDQSKEIIKQIHNEVLRQQQEFGRIFKKEIIPELKSNKIILLTESPRDENQLQFIAEYFKLDVLPYLQPILLIKGIIPPFLQNKALYLLCRISSKSSKSKFRKVPKYAILQIPTYIVPRFVQLPSIEKNSYIMFIDDIIREHINLLFPGYDVDEAFSFKLSRGAEFEIDDEDSASLIEKVKEMLRKRKSGPPSRFLYDEHMPKEMLKLLRKIFRLGKSEIVPGGKYHNFMDFISFPNPVSPNLQYPASKPVPSITDGFFEKIGTRDFLLHFPYHSFDSVVRFFEEATNDINVTEIYSTQYRVSQESLINRHLIAASKKGKKVTVFVELKARFDEETNLKWATEMKNAGIRVIYSLPSLKVHAKVALVKRQTEKGEQYFGYLSTGNFNEKTAAIYSDHGLFTSDKKITADLITLFRYLTDPGDIKPMFATLWVSQFNMLENFLKKIDREIENQSSGKPAGIVIKVNNLEYEPLIRKLYEASENGVKIKLIVRGICRLKPGLKGLSENITVNRLVDRFLEHGRIFRFQNNKTPEILIGSADIMSRNIEQRIEVLFPVIQVGLKKQLEELLFIYLNDNVKLYQIHADLAQSKIQAGKIKHRAQQEIYEYLERISLSYKTADY